MSETIHAPGPCALCGTDPARGFASVGDDWYCHGDLEPDPTCYMRAQAERAKWRGVYPGMCIDPDLCRGRSFCPRDYSCCE